MDAAPRGGGAACAGGQAPAEGEGPHAARGVEAAHVQRTAAAIQGARDAGGVCVCGFVRVYASLHKRAWRRGCLRTRASEAREPWAPSNPEGSAPLALRQLLGISAADY